MNRSNFGGGTKSIIRFAATPRSRFTGVKCWTSAKYHLFSLSLLSTTGILLAQSADNSGLSSDVRRMCWMGKRADWIFGRRVGKAWSHLGGPSSRTAGNDRVIMPRFVSGCLSAPARSLLTWNSVESAHAALPWRVCNNGSTAVNCDVCASGFLSAVSLRRENDKEGRSKQPHLSSQRRKRITNNRQRKHVWNMKKLVFVKTFYEL